MKKFWIQVVILLIISLGSLYLSFNKEIIDSFIPAAALPQTQLRINDITLDVEVADTASKRSRGLGGRDSLASSSGMLFIFESSKKYQFWMKGMKFPLDFIFIQGGKVVDLIPNVSPPTPGQSEQSLPVYQPVTAIDMMLEVNAGFISAQNIRIGDIVYLVKP